MQKKALKGEKAYTVRPGSLLKPADLKKGRKEAEEKVGRKLSELEFASYLMYPKVFSDFADRAGPVRPGERAADADLFLRHEAA